MSSCNDEIGLGCRCVISEVLMLGNKNRQVYFVFRSLNRTFAGEKLTKEKLFYSNMKQRCFLASLALLRGA